MKTKLLNFTLKIFQKIIPEQINIYQKKNEKYSLFESYKNKIIKASTSEIKKNPRSRSAKLRFATRSTDIFYEPHEFRKKFKYLTDLEERIA